MQTVPESSHASVNMEKFSVDVAKRGVSNLNITVGYENHHDNNCCSLDIFSEIHVRNVRN